MQRNFSIYACAPMIFSFFFSVVQFDGEERKNKKKSYAQTTGRGGTVVYVFAVRHCRWQTYTIYTNTTTIFSLWYFTYYPNVFAPELSMRRKLSTNFASKFPTFESAALCWIFMSLIEHNQSEYTRTCVNTTHFAFISLFESIPCSCSNFFIFSVDGWLFDRFVYKK